MNTDNLKSVPGKSDDKIKTRIQKDVQFPVVGIGASAGGLEAFEAFVQALPEDLGIAYVLVVHLDPSHASILPIDTFFRSLAQDRGSMTTGIILSGTGSDDTLGVRAIKGEAGLVMVQDLQSAKYDGMPRSAIASGLTDYVLPPEKIPEQLSHFAERQPRREEGVTRTGDANMLQALQKIYALLRTAT